MGTIGGKYRLIASLGRGGMADVYLAVAQGLAGVTKLVVVKELRAELADSPEFVAMFLDEARLATRLNHPAVVQTYEAVSDGRRLIIVMEYLDGQPLQRVLQRLAPQGGLPPGQHLAAIAEMLNGLHHAHELTDYDDTPFNVVHRDVSPHNVFVTYDGHIKLVDFGIAKALGSSLETRAGIVKGKISYMSPEQASGDVVDRRADIFSGGVMLWEAITHNRMWRGLDEVTILAKVLTGEVPAPRTVNPEVHPALEEVCVKALARQREERYESAKSMRDALLSAMHTVGILPDLESLGQTVAETFVREREELNSAIRAELHGLRPSASRPDMTNAGSKVLPRLGTASSTTPHDSKVAVADVTPVTETETQGAAPVRSLLPHDAPTLRPPRQLRRRRVLAFAVAGTLAAMGGAVAFHRVTQGAGRDQPPTASTRQAEGRPAVPDSSPCSRKDKPVVELAGEVESNAVLTCDRDYLLKFIVSVPKAVTLTIEKGTRLLGDGATKGLLVVHPGGRLVAVGTEEEPIVFTSEQPAELRKPGDWGGVILLGNAPVNLHDATGKPVRGNVEGITKDGQYGGALENDDSGILKYVRIEYAGTQLGPGNEINGLTLAGVGRNTVIDYVQVRHAADDCFEFFGGTVNAKHLICESSGDDGFDWDYGYRGKLQFLLLRQAAAGSAQSHGFEGDNDPSGSLNEPRSAPVIYNATLLGAGIGAPGEQYGMVLRNATNATIVNTLVMGFDAGIDVRGRSTTATVSSSVFSGNLVHNIAYPETAGEGPHADDDSGFDEKALFLAPDRNNSEVDPGFADCRDSTTPCIAPPNPLSKGAVAPPDDGFFDSTARFVGALRDRHDGWATGRWTAWDRR